MYRILYRWNIDNLQSVYGVLKIILLWYILYLGHADDTFWVTGFMHQPILTSPHYVNTTTLISVVKLTFMAQLSYQEMKNNQKNKKRLRSSCVQSFRVHFLYNYLMDFYRRE